MAELIPLKPGLYRFKNIPIEPEVGLGELYATGNGPEEPVKAFPDIPPFSEMQKARLVGIAVVLLSIVILTILLFHIQWNVTKGDFDDIYTIRFVEADGSDKLGLAVNQVSKDVVVLGEPRGFLLNPVANAPNQYMCVGL